jgi:small-conductance mechanosensitive channel
VSGEELKWAIRRKLGSENACKYLHWLSSGRWKAWVQQSSPLRRHRTSSAFTSFSKMPSNSCLFHARARKVPRVLKDPEPYVRITDFQPYAVEYTLYVFINEIKKLREIDAELRKAVFEACKRHKIDISTPTLFRQAQD